MPGGDLAVRIGLTEGPGGRREDPYFQRIVQSPGDPGSPHIPPGGDDSAEISGTEGRIAVRIDGGGGGR